MSVLLSALINHLLSVAETMLVKEEPQIVASVENELKLLVQKVENVLSKKSPRVAAVVNPTLTSVAAVADKAIDAAGKAAIGQ